MIDLNRLEKLRQHGNKFVARCPACSEGGTDKRGDHLFIANSGQGPYGCIAFPGPAGSEHRKRIWELVGVRQSGRSFALPPPRCQQVVVPRVDRIPALRRLTVAEMTTIAQVRQWPTFVGLELLSQRGLIHAGEVWDDGQTWPAWIASDRSRHNADARRIDGQAWTKINSKAKALKGGARGWPIGAEAMEGRELVVLCEGMPDFAAALLVAWWEGIEVNRVAPVCLTGASSSIDPDALPLFANKRVRIAVHDDPMGQGLAAAHKWAAQLYRAGATKVDGFDFAGLRKRDGQPVKDLADFATLLSIEPELEGGDRTRGARVLAGMAGDKHP